MSLLLRLRYIYSLCILTPHNIQSPVSDQGFYRKGSVIDAQRREFACQGFWQSYMCMKWAKTSFGYSHSPHWLHNWLEMSNGARCTSEVDLKKKIQNVLQADYDHRFVKLSNDQTFCPVCRLSIVHPSEVQMIAPKKKGNSGNTYWETPLKGMIVYVFFQCMDLSYFAKKKSLVFFIQIWSIFGFTISGYSFVGVVFQFQFNRTLISPILVQISQYL